jgi:hypothetical protein
VCLCNSSTTSTHTHTAADPCLDSIDDTIDELVDDHDKDDDSESLPATLNVRRSTTLRPNRIITDRLAIKPDPDPATDRPLSTLSDRSSLHDSVSDEMISPLEYHQSPTGAGPLAYSSSTGAGSAAVPSFTSAAAAAAAAVAAANQSLVSSNGCAPLFSPNSLLSQAATHHQAVAALVGAGGQTHHHQQPANQLLLYGNDAPDTKEGMDELCPVCGDKVSAVYRHSDSDQNPF